MKCDYYANGQQLQDIFLVICQIIPIEAANDPYRRYNFAGFLAQADGGPLTVICLSQVICHCAMTEMTENNFVGLMNLFEIVEDQEVRDEVDT